LRFKSHSGAWRGVPVVDGAIKPPLEGWGNLDYFITVGKKAEKRKLSAIEGPAAVKVKKEKDPLSDLIVLGLPYSSTEEEMREYFEKFGEVAHCELKYENRGGEKRSRGFGFVRFKQPESSKEVLENTNHSLGGRRIEVRFPKDRTVDDIPTKLFIGRLPNGTTADDLKECFSEYGPFKDVYVPSNFRNFGFITFQSQHIANEVLKETHLIGGTVLNVTRPSPRPGDGPQPPMQAPLHQPYGYGHPPSSSTPSYPAYQGGYSRGGHGGPGMPMYGGGAQKSGGAGGYYPYYQSYSSGSSQNPQVR